jgi:hypothetical protein
LIVVVVVEEQAEEANRALAAGEAALGALAGRRRLWSLILGEEH